MTTVLQYLIVAALIGLVVFGIAVFVFGRGEQLAALPPRTSPTELPERDITAADVGDMKLAMAVRGYRMSDVDWALKRLGNEIDRLRGEVAQLSADDPWTAAQPSDEEAQRRGGLMLASPPRDAEREGQQFGAAPARDRADSTADAPPRHAAADE